MGKGVFSTEVLGGGYEVSARKKYEVKIEGLPRGVPSEKVQLPPFSAKLICDGLGPIPVGPWIRKLLKLNVVLTDCHAESNKIDVLIGANLLAKLCTGKVIHLNEEIMATETKIGWYVNGEVPYLKTPCLATRAIAMTVRSQEITALWELDALGITDSAEKKTQNEQDLEVKEDFQRRLSRTKDGRYVVKLPWVSEAVSLPCNKSVAAKRLEGATNKLISKNEFENYDEIFKSWETEGIIEEVQVPENDTSGHYLPHRPVFKPESLTTPVRPVFDASCKVGRNPSLNQCLEKGPNMLELILSILLRFRREKVGAISDIRKAFQMIEVQEGDRQFQRFLWWKDVEKKIMKVYQHCRVVFGLNCSPFVLAAVLEAHLKSVPESERETSEKLMRSLYVDNNVSSFRTIEEYAHFKIQAVEMLARASMDLRQWESNTDEEMERNVTSVLGYQWDKREEVLFCVLPKGWGSEERPTITKRSVLSVASQVFDPIGFTSPAVLQLKVLLRESRAEELKWDQEWDDAGKERAMTWCSEMAALGAIKLPRWAVQGDELQIHAFGDASQDAYGGIVFVRSVVNSQCVQVQLLMAKSRVSPLFNEQNVKKKGKKMTIPRAELMGCLVAARLAETVKEAMDFADVPTYYWSDSTTALAWIRRDEDWGTFVGNRVRQILKLSEKSQWRHVPGIMNPADLPSRGCSPNELLESKWWEGPDWLRKPECEWPREPEDLNEEEVAIEKKTRSLVGVDLSMKPMQLRHASYIKNIRLVARTRRVLLGEKFPALRRPLSLMELRKAEVTLWIALQEKYFPNLKKIQVRVEKGEDQLLRVKSKLEYKEDADAFRNPILLPDDCPLVHELIREIHRAYGHAGIQFVINKLREKYWIHRSRKTVTKALRQCVICRRHEAKPLQVDPVALPTKRVTPGEVFTTTGVDLAGPLFLKDKSKVWVVLYTCAVYRCVVLDLVDSLDSESFIRSLQRFVTTYGRPNTIYSDNGTNFVGANNLFKNLDWEKIEKTMDVPQIQWIFNPPTAA